MRNPKRSTFALLGLILGSATCLGFQPLADQAVGIAGPRLADQEGGDGGIAGVDEPVALVIVVSAKRLRRIKRWEQAIAERFSDIPVIRIADVPRTSPTRFEDVARTLQRRLPADVRVLIDLEGRWAQRYALDVAVPNLLVFANGAMVAHHTGNYSTARFEALADQLKALTLDTDNQP